MDVNFEVGDTIKMKKKHPCGSYEWEILRVGADFRLKCKGCGHQIMIARKLVEKNTKEIQKKLETPSTRSFILLSDFKSVDFPHPLGPMNAVILFASISRFTFFSA